MIAIDQNNKISESSDAIEIDPETGEVTKRDPETGEEICNIFKFDDSSESKGKENPPFNE